MPPLQKQAPAQIKTPASYKHMAYSISKQLQKTLMLSMIAID